MAGYRKPHLRGFAGETILRGQVVTIDSGSSPTTVSFTVSNGAYPTIGVSMQTVALNDPMAVRTWTAGTWTCLNGSGVSIPIGTAVYVDASGKMTGTNPGGAFPLGYALTASSTLNEELEVLPLHALPSVEA